MAVCMIAPAEKYQKLRRLWRHALHQTGCAWASVHLRAQAPLFALAWPGPGRARWSSSNHPLLLRVGNTTQERNTPTSSGNLLDAVSHSSACDLHLRTLPAVNLPVSHSPAARMHPACICWHLFFHAGISSFLKASFLSRWHLFFLPTPQQSTRPACLYLM